MHKNGFAVLPAILESHRPIDVVVLMLGTNDLKHRFQAPVVEIAKSVGPARARHPPQLLPAPARPSRRSCSSRRRRSSRRAASPRSSRAAPIKSQRLADAYAVIAKRHGAGFLDAGEVIASSPLDGVHFDAAEHGKLGRAVAAALRKMPF